jgi:hypothetical protein
VRGIAARSTSTNPHTNGHSACNLANPWAGLTLVSAQA